MTQNRIKAYDTTIRHAYVLIEHIIKRDSGKHSGTAEGIGLLTFYSFDYFCGIGHHETSSHLNITLGRDSNTGKLMKLNRNNKSCSHEISQNTHNVIPERKPSRSTFTELFGWKYYFS